MDNKIIMAIITFLIVCILIIYKLLKVTMENKYSNNYIECVKNLYTNCNNVEIYLYIFTFNKKREYRIFYDLEKLIEFKKEFEKHIFDIEMLKINSYDNYIQLK